MKRRPMVMDTMPYEIWEMVYSLLSYADLQEWAFTNKTNLAQVTSYMDYIVQRLRRIIGPERVYWRSLPLPTTFTDGQLISMYKFFMLGQNQLKWENVSFSVHRSNGSPADGFKYTCASGEVRTCDVDVNGNEIWQYYKPDRPFKARKYYTLTVSPPNSYPHTREYRWYTSNKSIVDVLHRLDGPANIYYKLDHRSQEGWYVNGYVARDNGPARVEYYSNGQVSSETWFQNGSISRTDGPAIISYYPTGERMLEEWYSSGNPHRKAGPAYSKWNLDGTLQSEMWYSSGHLHNKRGPAKIEYGPVLAMTYYRGGRQTSPTRIIQTK